MLFLLGLLVFQHREKEFKAVWRSPRTMLLLLFSASLLSVNWGLYIYGVNTDRVVETSLGYFINPLVNVLLGAIVLKERLRWGQQAAVALAAIGVTYFVWQLGTVPWIALSLAFSFGLYGLVRKLIPVSPMVGLAVETIWMSPLALLLLSYKTLTVGSSLPPHLGMILLFFSAGIVTTFPLLWFNNAAKRLRLSTLGFIQYLAPTLQLLCGVLLYHESFTSTHLITFSCIWLALLIYSTTSFAYSKS
jgi:chloramphenicol-sensitive protein RarD